MNTPEVAKHIVKWLKDYATNAKVNGFVVGISGGIDSAVTSTLCAETDLTTLCVELPIHQAQSQVNRGNEHIKQLRKRYPNVKEVEVNLTTTFETFKTVVPEVASNAKVDLALANTRARLRMTTLYYFAGLEGLLVAGTGNKIEDFGVGFFTKYGDGGVDISPIADLMKSEVYEIASELDIIDSIQKAKPTDGLFGDNRTDEDQLGASYDELEWAMSVYKNYKPEDFTDRKKEVLEIFNKFNRAMQHKINPIPVAEIPVNLR